MYCTDLRGLKEKLHDLCVFACVFVLVYVLYLSILYSMDYCFCLLTVANIRLHAGMHSVQCNYTLECYFTVIELRYI